MLTPVKTFLDLEEALVARSFLESEGFQVLLQNENHSVMDPPLRQALGGYAVLSPQRDAAELRLFLADLSSFASSREKRIFSLCQHCGGAMSPARRSYIWAFIGLLSNIPYTPYVAGRRCKNCGRMAETPQRPLVFAAPQRLAALYFLAWILFSFGTAPAWMVYSMIYQ